MRRSSVRLRLWATSINPVRSVSYRVFLFLKDSSVSFFWHTHGTLNHNKPPLITPTKTCLVSSSEIRVNHSKARKFLFQCAVDVPFSSKKNQSSIEIKVLWHQIVALSMRRCRFWMIILYFCNFLRR